MINNIELTVDEYGYVVGISAKARSLAEFKEQMAELRRLGVQ